MVDNRIIASVVRQGVGKLLDVALAKALPVDAENAPSAKKTLLGKLGGSLAVRIATRSVPAAIVLGGAMLAKRRYDQRHGAKGKGADKA